MTGGRRGARATVGPAVVYLVAFFGVPLALVVGYSFARTAPDGARLPGLTLESYRRALDPLYLAVLWRSTWLALATTAISLVLAYPAAWAIRGLTPRRRALALALVVLPSWMNLLVKNYAWIVLLRRGGVVNSALLALGLVREPLPLLFNEWAVLAGLVHTYAPFMILPIYAALEKLDWRQVEAARDLGARGWQTFRRVVLPQTRAGALVGCTLVFIPALGAFVTPDLLGGASSLMIGTVIENQVLQVRDWPFASALAVWLMVLVVGALLLYRRSTDGAGERLP